ncbi:hypothetical protein [Clostridium beijerinckii]|uniref:Uncharacterized protein n=1 Tax=Clostridium beijerinckii TaxID=1520 RepID=A0A1S8RDV4_CLOBE|nr:hypothetical protein [Clostridium beijerinckii]NRY63830.1 hypothetical protein [Clostridium beijerinckii]OOM51255.1 hypothetical protein CLBCK_50730 [Clostridium beijerinckii]
MAKKNISEDNLIDFLEVILKVEGEVSLKDFKEKVKNSFNLTEYDLSQSTTRPNECMYEQRCRNLNSHKNFPQGVSYKNQVFKLN